MFFVVLDYVKWGANRSPKVARPCENHAVFTQASCVCQEASRRRPLIGSGPTGGLPGSWGVRRQFDEKTRYQRNCRA